MPATLSFENKLKENLKLRGMSVAEFAVVAKLERIPNSSRARLDGAFRNDDNALPIETATRLSALWDEIEEMALATYASAPWSVMSLSNGQRVHTSLQIFRGLRALEGNEHQ